MLYVYKSMRNKLQNEQRSGIIFVVMLLMLLSLFVSRAALSVSMGLFVLATCQLNRRQFRNFFSQPVLWGMALLFLVPLVSGLWTTDLQQWTSVLRTKLPLLLLPFCFAGSWTLSNQQWRWILLFFSLLVVASTAWCMLHYLQDVQQVHLDYLRAKTMRTPLENDHVRYSWLLVLAIGALTWLGILSYRDKQRAYPIFMILAAWLVLFLHLLAARTGLLAFYLLLGAVVIWLPLREFRKGHAVVAGMIIILLPMAAYRLMPSFQNRVSFAQYEWAYAWKGHYLAGSNDAMRVLSWKVGLSLFQQHPLRGIGFGAIATAVGDFYDNAMPEVIASDRILPSSELLLYGIGAGWIGVLVFLTAVIAPFFQRTGYAAAWFWLCFISLIGLLYDVGLEVQFGVFIYAIVLLSAWRYLISEKT